MDQLTFEGMAVPVAADPVSNLNEQQKVQVYSYCKRFEERVRLSIRSSLSSFPMAGDDLALTYNVTIGTPLADYQNDQLFFYAGPDRDKALAIWTAASAQLSFCLEQIEQQNG